MLLTIREQVCREQEKLDRQLGSLAHEDETTRLLMAVPVMGVVMALTIRHMIDGPSRFGSAANIGTYPGLPDETDTNGRSHWADRRNISF
ncbi:hypothetical protein [Mesorhizobium sp. M0323]|uniref:hypothetical protein n=1 Tax=Mesorhizobium sp. M0323 TaxID=2956938 RepID=UPI00333A10E2